MIRLLDNFDRENLRQLIHRSPIYNIYLLSNLDQLGFNSELCEFWGDVSETGELRGTVNRYMNGWSVYGVSEADWHGLAYIIDNYAGIATRLQDNPGGAPSLIPYLRKYTPDRISDEELMVLESREYTAYPAPSDGIVRRAHLPDLPELIDFYADAGSMTRSPDAVERPLRDLRVWVAEIEGRIVSSALTNAELVDAAMIGGVYTDPKSRGLGLAAAVCSALCAELLQERKQPALYWETPAAGIVYRRLGYRAIGTWRSVWLRTRHS